MSSSTTGTTIQPLSEATFERFRRLIYEKTNINMREGKHILVSNRLRKRIVALNLAGYDEYYRYLTESPNAAGELAHFFDAVSTNETYFFREMNHFTALRQSILPQLLPSRRRVRVWSAGCSTGEEVYTLKAVLAESGYATRATFEVIATDLSQEVVARAREGIYGERSLRFVPPHVLERYFEPADDKQYRVREALREDVRFQAHNLLKDAPPAAQFDLIFCRNVMIYFDKPTQKRLVDEYFAAALAPDGYLLIGHSESLTGVSEKFRYLKELKAPVYRKASP